MIPFSRRIIPVLLLACIFLTQCQPEDVLYVSTTGSDDNPGSKLKPLVSIEKARDLIRSGEVGTNKIILRGGTYYIDQTIEFGKEDSGELENPLEISAYEGEEVNINGGIRIQPYDFHKITVEEGRDKEIDENARTKILI